MDASDFSFDDIMNMLGPGEAASAEPPPTTAPPESQSDKTNEDRPVTRFDFIMSCIEDYIQTISNLSFTMNRFTEKKLVIHTTLMDLYEENKSSKEEFYNIVMHKVMADPDQHAYIQLYESVTLKLKNSWELLARAVPPPDAFNNVKLIKFSKEEKKKPVNMDPRIRKGTAPPVSRSIFSCLDKKEPAPSAVEADNDNEAYMDEFDSNDRPSSRPTTPVKNLVTRQTAEYSDDSDDADQPDDIVIGGYTVARNQKSEHHVPVVQLSRPPKSALKKPKKTSPVPTEDFEMSLSSSSRNSFQNTDTFEERNSSSTKISNFVRRDMNYYSRFVNQSRSRPVASNRNGGSSTQSRQNSTPREHSTVRVSNSLMIEYTNSTSRANAKSATANSRPNATPRRYGTPRAQSPDTMEEIPPARTNGRLSADMRSSMASQKRPSTPKRGESSSASASRKRVLMFLESESEEDESPPRSRGKKESVPKRRLQFDDNARKEDGSARNVATSKPADQFSPLTKNLMHDGSVVPDQKPELADSNVKNLAAVPYAKEPLPLPQYIAPMLWARHLENVVIPDYDLMLEDFTDRSVKGNMRRCHDLIIGDSMLVPLDLDNRLKFGHFFNVSFPRDPQKVVALLRDGIRNMALTFRRIFVCIGVDFAARCPDSNNAKEETKLFLSNLVEVIEQAYKFREMSEGLMCQNRTLEPPVITFITIPQVEKPNPVIQTLRHRIEGINDSITSLHKSNSKRWYEKGKVLVDVFEWDKAATHYPQCNKEHFEKRYELLVEHLVSVAVCFISSDNNIPPTSTATATTRR